jgi:hypothetical protein
LTAARGHLILLFIGGTIVLFCFSSKKKRVPPLLIIFQQDWQTVEFCFLQRQRIAAWLRGFLQAEQRDFKET